jgi:hypothetical protein
MARDSKNIMAATPGMELKLGPSGENRWQQTSPTADLGSAPTFTRVHTVSHSYTTIEDDALPAPFKAGFTPDDNVVTVAEDMGDGTWEFRYGFAADGDDFEWDEGVLFEEYGGFDSGFYAWREPSRDPGLNRADLIDWAEEVDASEEDIDTMRRALASETNLDILERLGYEQDDFMPTGRMATLAAEHGEDRVFAVDSHQERGTYSQTTLTPYTEMTNDDISNVTHIMVMPEDVPDPKSFAEGCNAEYDRWHTNSTYCLVRETAEFNAQTGQWTTTNSDCIGGFIGADRADESIQNGDF